MKKLYYLIFLLSMPFVYGMQKKHKSHKKFNIHNVQKKNGKNNRTVTAKKKQLKEELYNMGQARDNRTLALICLGSPFLFLGAVALDHYTRGIRSVGLLNWCIDTTYSTTPF